MSHFYGKVWGKIQSVASRTGTKNGGMVTQAASWNGAIEVVLFHNDRGEDMYEVRQIPWQGNGIRQTLAMGKIGELHVREREHV